MTADPHRIIRPFGASFRLASDQPAVQRAADAALSHVPQLGDDAGSFDVTVHVHADSPDDPAWPATTVVQHADGITLRCGSGRLEVAWSQRTARIDLPTSLLAIDDAVRCLLEGAVSSLLIGTGRIHALHSALVVSDGRGLVLRGQSGAGKSTLTYACMRSGFGVASDDWVYGIAGRSPTKLVGYPWRMFLMTDTVRFFPELTSVAPVPHPGADRWKLPIEPPAAQQCVTAPADAVVFLAPGDELCATRIDPAEATRRMWASALPSERDSLPEPWVGELVDRPCWLLERGTDPLATAAELQRIARTL